MPTRYSQILGCLLGTAVGDACGLRREGLSRQRAASLYGENNISPALVLGRGVVSDDTEHAVMVARAAAYSAGEVAKFERRLAGQLRCWLLTAPAGVGWATLRACGKLLLGFGPQRSGVWSAGNGPAMRSVLLGLLARDRDHLRQLTQDSTRIAHTDPRAAEGALLVAQAAALNATEPSMSPSQFLARQANSLEGDELKEAIEAVVDGLSRQQSSHEFADSRGWQSSVSGYVNQTVPAALYCWAASPTDFRSCVTNAVLLGGDTDTVAAITGAICGANQGHEAIPADWISRLAEWPRTVTWLEQLAHAVENSYVTGAPASPPSMHWPATLARNALFATIVLSLGLRRLLPPY